MVSINEDVLNLFHKQFATHFSGVIVTLQNDYGIREFIRAVDEVDWLGLLPYVRIMSDSLAHAFGIAPLTAYLIADEMPYVHHGEVGVSYALENFQAIVRQHKRCRVCRTPRIEMYCTHCFKAGYCSRDCAQQDRLLHEDSCTIFDLIAAFDEDDPLELKIDFFVKHLSV
jgi:hypothetical protein